LLGLANFEDASFLDFLNRAYEHECDFPLDRTAATTGTALSGEYIPQSTPVPDAGATPNPEPRAIGAGSTSAPTEAIRTVVAFVDQQGKPRLPRELQPAVRAALERGNFGPVISVGVVDPRAVPRGQQPESYVESDPTGAGVTLFLEQDFVNRL